MRVSTPSSRVPAPLPPTSNPVEKLHYTLEGRPARQTFFKRNPPIYGIYSSVSWNPKRKQILKTLILLGLAVFAPTEIYAQGMGRAGTITGTITDPSGAALIGATIEIQNKITGYERKQTADATGAFRFLDVPQANYHVAITANGFQAASQDLSVRTTVSIVLTIALKLAESTTSVDVHGESSDLVESVVMTHTDLDSSQFAKLPNTSMSLGLNSVIAHAAPGISEDSNGMIHPLGDHAQTQFVFDNQPVTDQQSKNFSTSMPSNAIASVEVIAGAAPAEYGDKTSLVVNAITKSGLGHDKTFGSLSGTYGSFGTIGENFTLGAGGNKVGNFLVMNTVRSGRYLDPPEYSALHDVGNNQTIFDRADYQRGDNDTLHLNLFFSRAWFQTPNTYDQQIAGQDQKQRILSYNIAPGWVHVINANSSLTVSPYFRQDELRYYPSRDAFADQPATVRQSRRLTNTGIKTDYSIVHGKHNMKFGTQLSHTFLTESFSFGITDPNFVDPVATPGLAAFDLTAGGTRFNFRGHTDIKQYAFYAQDNYTLGNLTIQAGLRADIYRGLASASGVQPRVGASYLFKPTNTVIRASYSRFFETPYNENLILSNSTGVGGLAGGFGAKTLLPGTRNQYNLGFEQSLGKHFVVEAGYMWKYTRNAYDFDNLFNSPIAFPISWKQSKIDGLSARFTLTEWNGFSAYSVIGHTRARFFGPEIGGLIFNSPVDQSVFRIDHDQAFEQTANFRYQRKKTSPWVSFTWKYDSGQVAGRIPDAESALGLSGDQQVAIGLSCGGRYPAVGFPISTCAPANLAIARLRLPAPGTENPDTNPPRIASRNIFDMAVGSDNLFHTEKLRYTLQLTAANLTNKVALYNFLSTFSGTHFVSPRAYTMEFGIVW